MLQANMSQLVEIGGSLQYKPTAQEMTKASTGFVQAFAGDNKFDHFSDEAAIVITGSLDQVGELKITGANLQPGFVLRRNPDVTNCYTVELTGTLRVIDDRPVPTPAPTTGPAPEPSDEPATDPTDEPVDEPATTPAQAEDPAVLGVTRAPEVIAEVTAFNADQDTAEVLGARRTTDAQQVLGARRGQTGDVDMSSNYMILCAALAGLMLILAGKRRRHE